MGGSRRHPSPLVGAAHGSGDPRRRGWADLEAGPGRGRRPSRDESSNEPKSNQSKPKSNRIQPKSIRIHPNPTQILVNESRNQAEIQIQAELQIKPSQNRTEIKPRASRKASSPASRSPAEKPSQPGEAGRAQRSGPLRPPRHLQGRMELPRGGGPIGGPCRGTPRGARERAIKP